MIILNFYVFSKFESKLIKYIILFLSFIYTLIKTNTLVSETFKYIFATMDNIERHKPNFNNYFIIHEFYYCLTIPILCLCMFELNKIFIIFVEITAIFLYYWKPKFHSKILNVT